MTPSITENLPESFNYSDKESHSSFSISDDDNHGPSFTEQSKYLNGQNPKKNSKMNNFRRNSMKEIRAQLRYSLEQRKQIFNSESGNKRKPESSYQEYDVKYNESKFSKKKLKNSKSSISRVEYKHFKKHEFFEEKIKIQREMVKTLIEDDPESDRKVTFKKNQSFVRVRYFNISLQSKLLNFLK